MYSAQIKACKYPESPVIDTERGRFDIQFLYSTAFIACFGKHTGWYRAPDGKELYVAVTMLLGEDGWVVWQERTAVTTVEDDRSGKDVSDPVEAGEAIRYAVEKAMAWLSAHPGVMATVELCDAKAARFKAQNALRETERAVSRRKDELAAARRAEREAHRRLEALSGAREAAE
jgi:hypothetical protein